MADLETKQGHGFTYYTLSLTQDERSIGKSISVKTRMCRYHIAARIDTMELATAFTTYALSELKRRNNHGVDIRIDVIRTNWTQKRENRVQEDSKIIAAILRKAE